MKRRINHFSWFFCVLRRFSPLFSTSLQSHSTKDFWLLGKLQTLNGDDLSREHLAALFLWHFLCVKALLKCEKGKIWKYRLVKWCISNESNNKMCESFCPCAIFSGTCCPTMRTHVVCFSYSTIYTMFPVFSLVLDKDVKSEVAMLYPELYKDLLKVYNEWSSPICYNVARNEEKLWIWCLILLFSFHRDDHCLSRHF